MNKIKDKIKQLRIEKNLSQKELAKTIGLSEKTISHYESGYSEPSLEIIIKLVDYFGISTDYLIGTESEDGQIETTHFGNEISEDEQELLDKIRKLNKRDYKTVVMLINSLIS